MFYCAEINGKNVTEADINLILDKSKDENLREKAYYEKAKAGDAIAEDIIDLIKMFFFELSSNIGLSFVGLINLAFDS